MRSVQRNRLVQKAQSVTTKYPTPDIIVYHSPCPDGFGAYWVLQKEFPNAEFHPRNYDDRELYSPANGDFDGYSPHGKTVWIVDYSYKREPMEMLAGMAASVVILDHHVTAQVAIGALLANGTIEGVFCMEKSGARLAWEAVHGDSYCPKLIQYIEDCDLWRHALPHAKAVQATILSHPKTIENWDTFRVELEQKVDFDRIVAEGNALLRDRERRIESTIKHTARYMEIGGEFVLCCNAPFELASEIGNRLANMEGNSFGASYYDSNDGTRNFSLRSVVGKRDVSKVAEAYSGGGHVLASGFSRPIGWEGDRHVTRVMNAFFRRADESGMVTMLDPDENTQEIELFHKILSETLYTQEEDTFYKEGEDC